VRRGVAVLDRSRERRCQPSRHGVSIAAARPASESVTPNPSTGPPDKIGSSPCVVLAPRYAQQ
jgi:hypothetical protein